MSVAHFVCLQSYLYHALLLFRLLNEYESSGVYVTFNKSIDPPNNALQLISVRCGVGSMLP